MTLSSIGTPSTLSGGFKRTRWFLPSSSSHSLFCSLSLISGPAESTLARKTIVSRRIREEFQHLLQFGLPTSPSHPKNSPLWALISNGSIDAFNGSFRFKSLLV